MKRASKLSLSHIRRLEKSSEASAGLRPLLPLSIQHGQLVKHLDMDRNGPFVTRNRRFLAIFSSKTLTFARLHVELIHLLQVVPQEPERLGVVATPLLQDGYAAEDPAAAAIQS